MMDNETFLLITGILLLVFLILLYGIKWAFQQFSTFYVAITVFNYLKRKIDKIRNEK